MMNERQVRMIGDFYQVNSSYLTSNYFVEKYGVSVRTVQSDIKQIRECLAENDFATFKTIPSKGSQLIVSNPLDYYKFMDGVKSLDRSSRLKKLSLILLNQIQAVSKEQLCQKLYVTPTTMTQDLNKEAEILEKFQLNLVRSSHHGIYIEGSENDKRRCLINLGLESQDDDREQFQQNIKNVLVEILHAHHYHMSDVLLQNLLVHLEISIYRIKHGFYLKDFSPSAAKRFEKDFRVAKEIFEKLAGRYYLKAPDSEILSLAIYIRGKSDLENEYISKNVDEFIKASLGEIKEKFNIDFAQEIELRVSLALHIIPLLTRIEFNIQNKNHLLKQIKRSFPLAFDMGAYMGMLIQKKINKKIEEGEIAYLAIYFNQYLIKLNGLSGLQRILIITNLKRSEDILLKQRLVTWFANEIAEIKIINFYELEEIKFDDYDVIFTTEPGHDELGAILINQYPDDSEYTKIKLAIDGFRNVEEITQLFSSERFVVGDFKTKQEVLNRLCQISASKIATDKTELLEAVNLREDLGSSYFGNQIALPHPLNPFSVGTFVSVVVIKNSLAWDEDQNQVHLALLVVIEKNNTKVFQLWDYLGQMIKSHHFVERVLNKPTYGRFISELTELLGE
ncbi:BglG family transcription antiterminator [Xylocopilactobacillus apicola]|uniref:PTS fructose transporter subunit IIA n=1 Tax=Xylocopilactobacillus apicola TaxID=2932184 RepID=A0AAU9CZ58_9LACO|nr:BglG family transcription antiterminator [Xylocopilactobacillus apicola]BDR57711.1 PTS fructose transporter subunit IIA [Xylocopilactobacillus apicola]